MTISTIASFVVERAEALKRPLSRLETFIGVMAAVISIGGALFGAMEYFKAPPPDKGQLVAIVEDSKTQKTVSGATIEILNVKQAVLATVTTNWWGRASHQLGEGQYRLRVTHPKFGAETRQVQVVSSQTTEVHVALRSGPSSPLHHVDRVINEGVSAVRRLFD